MRILVVAATDAEIAPLTATLQSRLKHDRAGGHVTGEARETLASLESKSRSYTHAGRDIDVLTTGVGMVQTAFWCARALASPGYDLALNVGVCGSFDRALAPGAVVHVVADRLVELGAEDGEAFVTIQDLRLLGANEFPFTGGQLVNANPPVNGALGALPAVSGVTVNTVHGDERSIAAVAGRFHPQVESMEGAAFMYACLVDGLAFAQVRAVSNVVGRRNRGAWKMADAIDGLGRATLAILGLA